MSIKFTKIFLTVLKLNIRFLIQLFLESVISLVLQGHTTSVLIYMYIFLACGKKIM